MDAKEVREKTREAYRTVGADYDSWYWMDSAKRLRERLKTVVLQRLERELSNSPKKENIGILDLCCGTGYLTEDLSRSGEYVGLDFADSMIACCKKRHPDNDFVLGSAEKLPFKDDSFDCVVCFWSFHHMVYPEEVINEVYRVIRPGGFVIIATFKDAKLNFAAKLADWVSSRYWGYATKRYSKGEMRKLLSKKFNSVELNITPNSTFILNALGIRFLLAIGRKGSPYTGSGLDSRTSLASDI